MATASTHRTQHGAGLWQWIITALLVGTTCMSAMAANDYYTEPQVFGMRPNPNAEKDFGPIGVTGIHARLYKGMQLKVEQLQPGTPAIGKFTKGDLILGVNGVMLKGKHPQVALGRALTKAESTDGVMTFTIKPVGSDATKTVTIKIPVLGKYSDTFPLNCDKTKKIIQRAAKFYAQKDRMKKHDLLNPLGCLFLLSTGDDQYLPRVKAYLAQFLEADGSAKNVGDHSWYNGYNGIACAEYYLRTGDKSVLPLLQYYCDDARDRQKYGIGWSHWGVGNNPAYEAGGGMQHAAGNQILLTLVLGKMCGVNVNDKTLLGALRHWYRFAGHGAIPIADQRYWMSHLRSAGRDGATAAVMQIASRATGDVTIYTKARDYLGLSALTSWPGRSWNWEMYWHSLASQFALDFAPDTYYQTMAMFQWQYDLARQASGGLWIHGDHPTMTGDSSGAALALALTAPLKTLQITGAPPSKHAKPFSLPERLWGNEADLAFLSPSNHKDFAKYGKTESIHIPWRALPNGLRYGPADAKGLSLDMMRKNARHWRCVVRASAAKALVFNGHLDEIETLLRDPDPRLRRAALDGISDCKPWFTSPPAGRNPLKADRFTPGMIEAIHDIMKNSDEAWFVKDGAMIALSVGPVKAIEQNLPYIKPWTTHEDWWMREAAFMALMGLQRDEELFIKHLPTVIDIMINAYHYNPRHKMTLRLEEVLAKAKPGSKLRKMLIDGLARAALESKVLPDEGPYIRSGEGMLNVVESALASIKQAPDAAADLAQSLIDGGRLKSMETKFIMKIVKAHDGHKHDRFVGLMPSLKIVSDADRQRLTDLLYTEYRPELLDRLKNAKGQAASEQLDLLIELTQLKRPVTGWQPIGSPKPDQRTYRFRSFDPLTKADELSPRIGPPHRLRKVKLPAGMDGWHKPNFDDSAWLSGKAPIGMGSFIARGHGRGHTATPDKAYPNNSDWGGGEFLVARTTFNVTDLDFDDMRIAIMANRGFHIYLNGKKIHTYVWFSQWPHYRKIMLEQKHKKLLKNGENTLAVFANLHYHKDRKTGQYQKIGQLDLWIEGLKRSQLLAK